MNNVTSMVYVENTHTHPLSYHLSLPMQSKAVRLNLTFMVEILEEEREMGKSLGFNFKWGKTRK